MRLERSLGILVALCAGLAILPLNIARAHGLVDQQQTGAVNGFPVDYWAQTFRPSVNAITAFDLDFFNAGGSLFSFQIRKVSDYSVVTTTGTMAMNNGVQHIDLPAAVPLIPETDYELRVFDSTPNVSGDYAVWGVGSSNPYPRGTARFPGGGNDSFGHDWYFVTYVPEPASGALLGLGMLGLFVMKRRRG